MIDDQLISDFVAGFELDQHFDHQNLPPNELHAGVDLQDWNHILWAPAQIETPKSELTLIYDRLPCEFPPLYERMVLTWRWFDISTAKVRLFENPPGARLQGLAEHIFNDPVFNQHLVASGYVPFGLDINNYDPVCFDTNRKQSDGDCMVVKFEHEALLSFDRIGESWVLWPSCRAMMTASRSK